MSAAADFKKAKDAFDAAIDAFKGELDNEGKIKDGLTASKSKKGEVLAVVLDDALTFYRACCESEDGKTYFKDLLSGVGALETGAKNPFNAISRYIWLRRFNKSHWDALKADQKQIATAKVAANTYATVMHRATAEKIAVAEMAKAEYNVTNAYGRVVKKKGLNACAANWKRTDEYNKVFPSDRTKRAPKHEAGLKALEELAGSGTIAPAFVRVTEGGEPKVVQFIDLADHPDLLARLYELFAPKAVRGKAAQAEADKKDDSLAGFLKRVAAFAALAGADYAMRFVDASNSIRVHTGKRGTRNSIIGDLVLPKRNDISVGEFVITSDHIADMRSIVALSKKIKLEINGNGLLFTLLDDSKTYAELMTEKKKKPDETWSVSDHTITIPLPHPKFSMPIVSTANEPKWFAPRIAADDTLQKAIADMEGEVNEMPKGTARLYKFSMSKDKFEIRDLAADHNNFSEHTATISDGPNDKVDIPVHTGIVLNVLSAVRDFADGKPITLSVAQNMLKFEAEGVSYCVPAMDDKDMFRTTNVGEWNEVKRTRREA